MASHMTTTIRPPAAQALGEALQILLESSNSENFRAIREDNDRLIEARDNRIKAYEALIESTHAALDGQLKEFVRQRRALTPLHRLPLSVFTAILAACLDEVAYSERPTLLRILASVSSSWLKAVKSTPALWTLIDGSWGLQTIQLFLRKSGGAPLDVRYVLALGEGTQKLRTFLAAVQPHCARWRSLTCSIPDFESLEIPAHILEKVQISSRYHSPSVTLASSKPLPAIKVEMSSFTWTGQMVGLRTLHLGGIYRNVPACNQVLSLIAQSPHLESIHFFNWRAPNRNLDARGEAIHVPRLHTLRCQMIPDDIQCAIARDVVAPACLCIGFEFMMSGSRTARLNFLNHFTNGIGAQMRSLFATRKAVDVKISAYTTELSSSADPAKEGGVYIQLPAHSNDHAFLQWLSSQLPEQTDVALNLYGSISAEDLDLGLFSGVSSLIWTGGNFGVLAKPECSNNQVTWPLPRLTKLDLRSQKLDVQAFKEFVWDRWGICDKTHTRMEVRLGIMVRPSTLEDLELSHGFSGKVTKAYKHALNLCTCRDI
ncbi:hypothetical protein FRC01_007941 [Tulasnella sp. 417]|nr:hypothetical protein FRC01_007941 [Tulasnella sp. 417]